MDFLDRTFEQRDITTTSFRITTFSRIINANRPITVYIDGDVRGWKPSAPVGIDSVSDEYLGLKLAALDPSENVIFIASPCQFKSTDPLCHGVAWKQPRMAEQVYASMNRALDHLLAGVLGPQLHLVGYSGGGAVATVMAGRRRDVISLRTLAGNLDPDGNGRAHATLPQVDFIDPMIVAPRLTSLPQEHYVGDRDVLVPPFLTQNFVKALRGSFCTKVTHVPHATHKAGWEEMWKKRVGVIPTCGPRSYGSDPITIAEEED